MAVLLLLRPWHGTVRGALCSSRLQSLAVALVAVTHPLHVEKLQGGQLQWQHVLQELVQNTADD